MKINALKIFLLFFFLALPRCCWSSGLGSPGTNPNIEFDGSPAPSIGAPYWLVNTGGLNFIIQDIDLRYSSKGMAIEFIRTYNANDPTEGIFGRSWTFNYNVTLTENSDRSIDIRRGDGKVDRFLYGSTHYRCPVGVYDTLTKNNDGTYSLNIKRDKTTQNFNAQGRLTNIKDRNNNAITFIYDIEGNLSAITDPDSKSISLEYNSGNKVSRINLPDGRHASFTYDDKGNLVQSINTNGDASSFTSDSEGYIVTITTAHQGRTTIVYSAGGGKRVVRSITDALGSKRRYGIYDSYQVRIFDSRNNATLYQNNSDGYTKSITTASGDIIAFEYDNSGNRNKITDSEGNATILAYDSKGNIISVTDPLNNKASFSYDNSGNLIKSLDAEGNMYSFAYDVNSNLIEVRSPDNQPVSFAYNSYGQLTRVSNAKSGVREFSYDDAGNLEKMTSPLGKITSYGYDTLGRLVSLVDPKGQAFAYAYDGADHLIKITYPDAASVDYTYNNCCNLVKVQDKNGRLQFSYDAIGRMISFTNYENKVISYGYDSEGNLASLIYPDNKQVRYEYNRDNRLAKVTDWLGNITRYTYDARGNLFASVSPGLLTIYKYDAANRLYKLINYNSNTLEIISGFEFSLDALANRTRIKGCLAFNIPRFDLADAEYTYNSADQLNVATGRTFEYDDNGNLIKQVSGRSVTALAYDYDNRLTNYISGPANLAYLYDALGNRIKKISGSSVTKYIIDPNCSLSRVLSETNASGAISAHYIYGLGLISKIQGSNAYFYQYDGLGSTAAITDAAGAIKNQYVYDDFGNLATNSSEIIPNPFKYVGKFGVVTDLPDLLYMRARYYSPSIGRFITKSPLRTNMRDRQPNRYVYTDNNPINRINPTGE